MPEEDRTPGTHPSVVVSHRFWRGRLAADPLAAGRSMSINGVALTVVGVAPESFTGVMAGVSPFKMAPLVLHDSGWLARTDSHSAIGVARLNPGVSQAQAAAELTLLTRRFDETIPGGLACEDGAILEPSQLVPTPLRV